MSVRWKQNNSMVNILFIRVGSPKVKLWRNASNLLLCMKRDGINCPLFSSWAAQITSTGFTASIWTDFSPITFHCKSLLWNAIRNENLLISKLIHVPWSFAMTSLSTGNCSKFLNYDWFEKHKSLKSWNLLIIKFHPGWGFFNWPKTLFCNH